MKNKSDDELMMDTRLDKVLLYKVRNLLALLILLSPVCYADFVVSTCPPSSENYGNSQTAIFRRAISGIADPCAPIDEVIVPERDYDRWYIRARLNYGTLIFDQVRNRSIFIFPYGNFATSTLTRSRAIKNQTGFEIAVGYVISPTTRWDLEYIASRNLSYNTGLLNFGGSFATITANFKNNLLLLNGYYEFTGLGRLKPYLTAGFGPAQTSVQSSIASPIGVFNSASTTRSLRLAWQVGAGARLIIFPPRWSLDFSYRYVQIGNNVRVIPIGGVQINGRYSLSVLSIGLVVLF